MKKEEFVEFLEQEIKISNEAIEHAKPAKGGKPSRSDESSKGKLCVYEALLQYVNGKPSYQSLGVVGAINDTCQKLQLMDKGKTVLSLIQN